MSKIYIKGDKISIQDPTHELLPFIAAIAPSYTVSSFRPSELFMPQFQQSRTTLVPGIDKDSIHENSTAELNRLHSVYKTGGGSSSTDPDSSINLLHLKKEIVFRHIRQCELCAWRCRVNRYNEKGKCGLDYKAFYLSPFIHIAEEAVVNPAIVVNFSGCSWDCVYCIGHELNGSTKLIPLDISGFWSKIYKFLNSDCPVNTLEFAGGNPTESLHWILEILLAAPDDFKKPIVWNCNPYATIEAVKLLEGIVDIFLIDFRYGNDECARRLSGVKNCWAHSMNLLEALMSQNEKVIIRILVLPNHVECCHRRVLEWLSYYREHIWVSILDQYIPEHMAREFRDINRRPTSGEIKEVENLVQKYGLRDIKEYPEDFWP